MIKRILVGLGGTPYTTAEVRHALNLAKAHDAEVTAATVIDLARVSNVGPVPIGGSAAAAELVQHRLATTEQAIRDAISFFEKECVAAGVRHRVITEAGDPFDELTSLWRYHDITVLALRSLFEYGVVRDPQDMLIQLIARGVRPIVAVAPRYRPIKRVLIAYNGSMESAKAMKQFMLMALWPHAELQIACVGEPYEKAGPLLRDATEYCRLHGYEVEGYALSGEAHEAIMRQAEEWQADLVVMGATARARIFRHLLGDTALHMVKHSEIPLFLTQ